MRGVIQNIARKQQINDFSGLAFGRITPTDLDGVIEYHNKAYVFFEIKYLDAPLPFGQRLCLERLVKDTQKSGKKAIAIVISHNVHNVSESVNVAASLVRELYLNPFDGWKPPKWKCTAFEMISAFIDYSDK